MVEVEEEEEKEEEEQEEDEEEEEQMGPSLRSKQNGHQISICDGTNGKSYG